MTNANPEPISKHRSVHYRIEEWLNSTTHGLGALLSIVGTAALNLTVAGGLVYTAGVGFYLADRIPYMHAIWHLFVIGGSACHFSAIYLGVLPHVA